MERIYIIPLRKAKRKPRSKRANAAIRVIKEFLQRHMKVEEVKIDNKLNEYVWEHGMHKIPSRVKVKAIKKENSVIVTLFE
ncbi:MAG TPA: 50S ribosomal protein L31e [Candidatus Aenigmarchaeota archaeon]|nr:50S ribosomal protein L31e [Candidatus Aenigmarchaeota archaeon]